ncbi:hypothetical protein [Curtanaerobium respiraculi]|jgi:hypothetical protein|uniref:hypothetical protein n=1 Tax=Curtanaerobium respiraculi TaxID=2949669 RepID=UPI0024B32F8F|nr:hypothetical protein [Curtanaerobium respiraculi]
MADTCKVLSTDGDTMIELKSVRAEDDHMVVVGALMGAWDSEMILKADDVKAAVGMVDIPSVAKFILDNVLGVKVEKIS